MTISFQHASHLCAVAFLLCLALTSPLAADTLSSNLSATTAGSETISGSTWAAASFTTGNSAYTLDSVTLLLANPSAGIAAAYIYSDGGLMPGALVATLLAPSSFSGTIAQTVFTAGGVSLSANSTYWVVLRALNGTFNWAWTAALTGDGAGYTNTWGASQDAGTTWYTYAVYPLQMAVQATPGSVGGCAYSLDALAASAPAAGSSGTVSVTTTTGCTWTAASNVTWITISSGATGAGSRALAYTVAANAGTAARTGTLTIAGSTFTITQAGAASSCSYTVSPASVSLSAAASSGTITVTSTGDCSWTAASNAAWLTISSGAAGSGSGSATYTATANTTGAVRTAAITIAGQTITATQQPVITVSCGEFSVAADGRCMWRTLIPWVAFGAGWESRVKFTNKATGSAAGPIEVDLALLPLTPETGGIINHLPAFIQDSRTSGTRMIETASYALASGESVEVRFLYPPVCDSNGANCSTAASGNTLSTGSLQLSYLVSDPAYLRGLAQAQLMFLASSGGHTYGLQASERQKPAANNWIAPVAVSIDQTNNLELRQSASAAIANPNSSDVTVTGALTNQSGTVVASRSFTIPANGTIATVFGYAADAASASGFGAAMFSTGTDFTGWVTFSVVSSTTTPVNVIVIQNVGYSVSTADAQSF